MGDDDDRAVLDDAAHVALDDPLALVVERRGRLVENENARIGRERAGDGDALSLPAGEVRAALLDQCVVAFGELVDELVGAGEPGDLDDAGARHRRIGEGDVLVNGAVEQEVLLQHDADVAPAATPDRHGSGPRRRAAPAPRSADRGAGRAWSGSICRSPTARRRRSSRPAGWRAKCPSGPRARPDDNGS